MKLKSDRLQLFMSVALTGILAFNYLVVSWETGPSHANISLNSTLIIGGIFIVYYTDKLTNMDLVKGYWSTISYKSIGDKRRNMSFNFRMFFIRLISGDIIPHSFVGSKIMLRCDPENIGLLKSFYTSVQAEIVDRLVVTCHSKKTGLEYKDPYWFQLKSTLPILSGETNYYLRFLDDSPSFDGNKPLIVFLFCLKNSGNFPSGNIHRDDLRALGKVLINKIE